ncbi:hypothetical protein [Pseudonocardia lacus]|uniref:hypothetical protein n=1 Tax=Pseudonocardia lacus TaxID=2835865 RepID=UPI001BDDA57F|nr:hypothetical protein [Pseudonocardia lacus]
MTTGSQQAPAGEPGEPEESETGVHERIARRLADLAATDPQHPPHPYIRRYLTEHAAHGGVLDDAHVPAEFLPWETSGRVRASLGLPFTHPDDRPALAAWARIEPFLTADTTASCTDRTGWSTW